MKSYSNSEMFNHSSDDECYCTNLRTGMVIKVDPCEPVYQLKGELIIDKKRG